MRRNIHVGRYIGIDVYLHYSWFIIFALLAWGLATGWFPSRWPDQPAVSYWILGLFSSLLLFVSVLLHELSHSVMARRNGIKVDRITLFFFGGMAGMHEQKMSPKAEFQMAIAGPAFSLLLSGAFLAVYNVTSFFYVAAVASYLYRINLILAIFNLVPGFPLDGGRVLRSVVWYWTKDFKKATRVATLAGKFVAYFLIFTGFMGVFSGNLGSLWAALIGFFLLMLSTLSYEQVVIKDALTGRKAGEFLVKRYITLEPDMTVRQALTKFIDKGGEAYPVVHGKEYHGILLFKQLQELPKQDRAKKVKDIMVPATHAGGVTARTPAYQTLIRTVKSGIGFMPVLSGRHITGIVKTSDIMRYVKLKTTQERLKKMGFNTD